MATHEIKNGCGSSIEAVLASNQKRRRGYSVHLWNLAAADPRAGPVLLLKSVQWLLAVAFSPDGHWLAAGGIDALVRLWDLTVPDFASRPALLRTDCGGPGSNSPIADWRISGLTGIVPDSPASDWPMLG